MNHSTRESTSEAASTAIGGIHARCRKLRPVSASEPGGGDTQAGICSAMPKPAAAWDCTRYWCQISCPKGPPASMAPPTAPASPPAM